MQIERRDHNIVHFEQEAQAIPFTRQGEILLVELVLQLLDLFVGFLQRAFCHRDTNPRVFKNRSPGLVAASQ